MVFYIDPILSTTGIKFGKWKKQEFLNNLENVILAVNVIYRKPEEDIPKSITVQNVNKFGSSSRKSQVFESTRLNVDKDDVDVGDKTKKIHHQ